MRWLIGLTLLAVGCDKSGTDVKQNYINNSPTTQEIIYALTRGKKVKLVNGIKTEEYQFSSDGIYTAFGDPPVTLKYYIEYSNLCMQYDPTVQECWHIDTIESDGSITATSARDKRQIRFAPAGT